MTTYPTHLLAREPAPAYAGEGEFALWHFSENPSLSSFVPRPTPTNPGAPAAVWAVDTRHAPMFWFPRDCPRGCIWPVSTTTEADRDRFFGQTVATRIHVIEGAWLRAVAECRLFAYRLPADDFEPHDVGGYWIADTRIEALERVAMGNLLKRHVHAGIELRLTPSIGKFWDQVVTSSVEFSGLRLRNAGLPG